MASKPRAGAGTNKVGAKKKAPATKGKGTTKSTKVIDVELAREREVDEAVGDGEVRAGKHLAGSLHRHRVAIDAVQALSRHVAARLEEERACVFASAVASWSVVVGYRDAYATTRWSASPERCSSPSSPCRWSSASWPPRSTRDGGGARRAR